MSAEPKHCDRCGRPHAGCSAHTRAGKPCGNQPMAGQRVCRMHGGSSPRALAAAAERQETEAAEAVVRKLWSGLESAAPVKDPVASMERLAGALEQLVDEAGARVESLKGVGGGEHLTQLRAEVVLFERALGHLRGLLVDMARLGIAERHVQLEQARADLVTAAFLAALGALAERVTLLPADRDAVLRAFLAGLGVDAGAVAGEVAS